MQTVLGTILDPAADKALMTTLTVSLAYKSMLPSTPLQPLNRLSAEFDRKVSSASSDHHPRERCSSESLGFLLSIYFLTRTCEVSPIHRLSIVDQCRFHLRKPSSGIGIFQYLLRKCGQRKSANITLLSNCFLWDVLPSALCYLLIFPWVCSASSE